MKRPKVNPVFDARGRKRSKGDSSRSARMTARGRRTNGVRATKALAINPDNRSMVTRSMVIDELEEDTLNEVGIIQAPVKRTNDDNKPTEKAQQQPEVVPVENKGDDEESLVLDDLPKTCNYEVQVPPQQQLVHEVVPEENKGDNEESLVVDDLLKISNYEVQVPQQQQEQLPVIEVVPIKNKGDDKESLVLDDLPKICNHEVQVPQQQEQQQPVDVVPVENKGDGEESLVLVDLPVISNYEEAWPCFNDGNGYGWNSYWEPTNEFWEPFGDVNFEPVLVDDLWNFKDNDDTKKL